MTDYPEFESEADAAEAYRLAALDHVNEVVFDASESYDPDCVLCREADRLGLWQEMGFDPPGEEPTDD